MVLKPVRFIARGGKGLIQPAMKVRGHDDLWIIHGPDQDLPRNIARLHERGLGRKFSLADRAFHLGREGCTASSGNPLWPRSPNVRLVCWRWRVSLSIRGLEVVIGSER